jgi:hypothetical protein
VLNRGLDITEAAWLMMGVYVILALGLIVFDRRPLLARPPVPL